jgi:2-haloacid dehalogenase
MSSVKAVVFDAYGTLFDVTSIAGACRERFGAEGDRLTALWRDKQLEYTWLRSLMCRYESFRVITADALRYSCGRLGLECDDAWVERMMARYDHLSTYPDVLPALKKLKRNRLAVLSNGTFEMLEAVTENNGLAGTFSALISVEFLKMFKPDPRVYALACRVLGVGAGEIAFVSSNYFDIAGAAAYGFDTYWINRRGDHPDLLGTGVTKNLSSLEQLPACL